MKMFRRTYAEINLDHLKENIQAIQKALPDVPFLCPMVKANAYDLILMDMQMPHVNGLDATRQIRQFAEGGTVPIIAMTANAFAEDRELCLEAGMNDFIAKPVSTSLLYQKLCMWLQKQR